MYRCTNCGGDRIIERTGGIIREAEADSISVDDGITFKNPKFDFRSSKLIGYFCFYCDKPIVDSNDGNKNRIRSEKDLAAFIKREYKK